MHFLYSSYREKKESSYNFKVTYILFFFEENQRRSNEPMDDVAKTMGESNKLAQEQ